jgi:uncharacterized protein (TIGR03437 family)
MGYVAPILEVYPYWGCPLPNAAEVCTPLAAITVQVPFEAQCGNCSTAPRAEGEISVIENGTVGLSMLGTIFPDQVHILTTCDALMLRPGIGVGPSTTGLPCPSVVTHADGSPVSATNAAQVGEELVAYAVGLGQTNPPLETGKLVSAAAPALTTFGLDFNYHPNALPSKPLPSAPAPAYAGATPGYVGLYQVNFVVPPVPAGTLPCFDPTNVTTAGPNVVYSNLTVSVGGAFSFDGARVCVAVP